MNTNGEQTTKVRFSLWGVLAFLVVLSGVCFGYLFTAQATTKDDQNKINQAVNERVIKLEERYMYICNGITRIENGQENLERALKDHEKSTLAAIKRNGKL
jgi:exonuclease VII small subunit